jgi:flagellar export protein FliJ
LLPLVGLAKQRSMKGLEAVAYMRSKLVEEEQRLSHLQQCQCEYEATKSPNNQSVSAQTLKAYEAFKGQLATAIMQQGRQVETVRSQLAEVESHWQTLNAKALSMEKTQSRLQQREALQLSRREQKLLDDQNNVRHARTQARGE